MPAHRERIALPAMADFTREELAHAAGVSTDLVERLTELQL
jgi:hypothetical protein